MADLLATGAVKLPPIPASFGHGHDFPNGNKPGDWGMLGNGPDDNVSPGFQGCGDCVEAGTRHEIMALAKNSGHPIPPFSAANTVGSNYLPSLSYSWYSGYNPQTGTSDTGTDVQTYLAYRQSPGVPDDTGALHKIGGCIYLEPGNITHLWAGAYIFEVVCVGVQLQQAQMNQFDNNQTWDWVKGSPADGGHYVPVMGKNGLVTWGEQHGFTNAFYQHCNDESYCYLGADRYNAVTGETAEHFTAMDLEKWWSLIGKST